MWEKLFYLSEYTNAPNARIKYGDGGGAAKCHRLWVLRCHNAAKRLCFFIGYLACLESSHAIANAAHGANIGSTAKGELAP